MHPPSGTRTEPQRSGEAAERAAQTLLQQQGLQLLQRNARFRQGELDLVMRDGNCVVFVEVRQRRHAHFGGAAASIHHHKQQRLIRAAQLWLSQHPAYAQAPCRFDAVLYEGDNAHLYWVRDAFRPGES